MSISESSVTGQETPVNRLKKAANSWSSRLVPRVLTGGQNRAVPLFLAFWALFACAEIAKDWYMVSSGGWRFALGRHAGHAAFIFLPWFAFSLYLGSLIRTQLFAAVSWRSCALHSVLAVSTALLHLLIVTASFWIFEFRGTMAAGFAAVYVEMLFSWVHYELLVYIAVLLLWRSLIDDERMNTRTRAQRPRLMGRIDGETHVVTAEQVDWIASADGAAIAHAGDRKIRIRESLKQLAERLRPASFIRVHRSAIVNVNRLRGIDGDVAVLATGERVKCSRAGKRALRRALSPNSH